MMVVFKKKKVESSLKKKGFKRVDTHHRYYTLFVNDKDTGIFTKVSHGGSEIVDFHVHCMSDELGINKKEFLGLVNCPIDKDKLVELLRNKYNKKI